MTILYEVHDNLYVNLTNKCPCSCTFCLRQTRDHMENSGVLWLEREPSYEEVIAEFSKFDLNKYKEVVFCGLYSLRMKNITTQQKLSRLVELLLVLAVQFVIRCQDAAMFIRQCA